MGLNEHLADRPVTHKRGYYFARFFGFARVFGVNGCGGEFSIVLSKSSVRRCASSKGRKSIDLSSLARLIADVSFRLVMV